MSTSEVMKAVHALACIRHLDANPYEVQVVVGPATPSRDGTPAPLLQEVAQYAPEWNAQVRLGGGKWGHNSGVGKTPEEALSSLLAGYVVAHLSVDNRRAAAFEAFPALGEYKAASEKTAADGPDPLTRWASRFATQHMAEALHRNAHKGGRENWLKDGPLPLLKRVQDELAALNARVRSSVAPGDVFKAAASVANMAGMVADAYAFQSSPQSSDDEK